MKENFEYKGEWFLPSAKNKRVNGILRYDAERGISLELFGSFNKMPFMRFNPNEDIIQGVTSDSKQITLYRCYMTKSEGFKLVIGDEIGMPSTIYSAQFIFEGVHIETSDEIKFQKIVSEIHNLDEWVGITGFTLPSGDFEGFEKLGFNVQYKRPESIKFTINENFEGYFNFVVNHSDFSRYQKEMNIRQRVEIIINSHLEHPVEILLKHLISFQNFLILALYHRTYPNSVTLYNEKFSKDYGDGKPERRKVKLYFPIPERNRIDNIMFDYEMLFSYMYIREEFPKIIKKWYEKYDVLEPAFNLLFEQFYNGEVFSENTFLNLAQAAETFHARVNHHTRMSKEDFKKMRDEIYLLVPDQYHDWLKDQFNFGNNLNLHTRLTEIISKYSNEILDKIIGDKELFVKQVKWSRNYYTHYSSGNQRQALKGAELIRLTKKLKMLLVCAFLIEIGFDKEKLKNGINKKMSFF